MKKFGIVIVAVILVFYLSSCQESTSSKYEHAQSLLAENKFSEAADAFSELGSYEDAVKLTMYCKAATAGESGDYETAVKAFQGLGDYKDSLYMVTYYTARAIESRGIDFYPHAIEAYKQITLFRDSAARIKSCQDSLYAKGLELKQNEKYEEAIYVFNSLNGYSDSADQIIACRNSIPERDYQAAKVLQESGKYEDAITAYKILNGYSDSADQIKECRYQQAKILQESLKYDEAYAVYASIKGYKDVDSIIALNKNIAAAAVSAARKAKLALFKTVGNIVTFGKYEQDNNTQNGQEEIEWIVLDVEEGKSLLLSLYGLDAKPYNKEWTEITWEKCTLRNWLNREFIQIAFTEAEKAAILLTEVYNNKAQGYREWNIDGGNNTHDQIFLLSYAEANKYLGVTYDNSDNQKSCVTLTAFAKAQGAELAGWWWLRSPGDSLYSAAHVNDYGSLRSRLSYAGDVAVRPVFWLNLESDLY